MLFRLRMLWLHAAFLSPAREQNTAIVCVKFLLFILSVFSIIYIYCVAGSVKWIICCYEQSSVYLYTSPNICLATSDLLCRSFVLLFSPFLRLLCACAAGYCVDLHESLLQL